MSSKKRKLQSNNTTGYTGVYKNGNGKRFQAQIYFDGKSKSLGMYATSKEAALAYDHAVIQHNLPSSKLNYPDGLPIDDKDYDALMNPKRTRRKLSSANTTGYTGVAKINTTRFSFPLPTSTTFFFPKRINAGSTCCRCRRTSKQKTR